MPRTTVPLYRDDDYEDIIDARRKVELAKAAERSGLASGTARAGDDDEAVAEAVAEYEAVLAKAAERAEMWVLHSIGRTEFRQLLKDHPPRVTKTEDGEDEVNPEDAVFGVNTDTFPQALLGFVDKDDEEIRTVLEPEFDTDRDRHRRFKRLSEGEYDTLWTRALGLNRSLIRDPKREAP